MNCIPNVRGGLKVMCSCCGQHQVAEIRDRQLIIMDRSHGKRHMAILSAADLLPLLTPCAKITVIE